MKLFKKMKDGGAESTVTGYWLVEIKSLFSIVLLRFDGYSREAYHQHAFNCWNWLIKGALRERFVEDYRGPRTYIEGDTFVIRREDFHKVDSIGGARAWLLSIRGPWCKTWKEYIPAESRYRTLKSGRVEV